MSKTTTIAALAIVLCVSHAANWVRPVYGHGGKTQSEQVTALGAIQKALPIYDRLIGEGKIDSGWETTLSVISVMAWLGAGPNGWSVSFTRAEGNPPALFIFLDPKGNYAGSNFTGP